MKKLTPEEHIDLYKLLVHYCTKFADHDTQLLYLNYLQDIFQSKDDSHSKSELLKVKRNIAMIFNQKKIASQTQGILKEIRVLFYLFLDYLEGSFWDE